MQKSGGGLIRKPVQNLIKKVGQKMSRRRNSANPGGLKKLLLPGGGKISPMHNPLLPKGAQQLEGLTSQHIGRGLKEGGESYGQKRKLATTQAEARKGSVVKKPPPMPFPFMNFRPQMLEEVFNDSIEFAGIARSVRVARKHSAKKGGIFVDNAPRADGTTTHLRGRKNKYKKGTALKGEFIHGGNFRIPSGQRGAQARYKVRSSIERAKRNTVDGKKFKKMFPTPTTGGFAEAMRKKKK